MSMTGTLTGEGVTYEPRDENKRYKIYSSMTNNVMSQGSTV